ncbi:MAG: TIGR02117 family protein [Gemmatimonadota bacterium]
MRRVLRMLAFLVAGPPLLYLLAALVLGVIPVGRERAASADTDLVTVFIRTNGVHAEFVFPARGPYDWSREFPLLSIVDARRVPTLAGFNWIAFGWGDRAFYLETPRWRDLRLGTALGALSGRGPAAMHVEYLVRPQDYKSARIDISSAQYRELVDYVRAGFARDAHGRVIRIDHPGYFATDAFFEGTGHYSPWLTSNEWVRRGLARAGVRTASWAPFDVALFWQLYSR